MNIWRAKFILKGIYISKSTPIPANAEVGWVLQQQNPTGGFRTYARSHYKRMLRNERKQNRRFHVKVRQCHYNES